MILGLGFGGFVFLFVVVGFGISFLVLKWWWVDPCWAWKACWGTGRVLGLGFLRFIAFFKGSLRLRLRLRISLDNMW